MLVVDKNAEYRLALFSLVQYNDNILQNRGPVKIYAQNYLQAPAE